MSPSKNPRRVIPLSLAGNLIHVIPENAVVCFNYRNVEYIPYFDDRSKKLSIIVKTTF